MQKPFILSNGLQIPSIGFGTWLIPQERACLRVSQALKIGYRHVDSAQDYGNEAGVGEAIRESGLPRESIFVTTKIKASIKRYGEAKSSLEESFSKLGLNYIDLVLIHAPQPWEELRGPKKYYEENRAVWACMEEFYKNGRIKSIGVSNFLEDDLEHLMSHCSIKPMVNQICLNIGDTDSELVEYCQKQGILVEAYCPIAHGKALSDPFVITMAKKYSVSPAVLCLAYALELGTLPLPKSENPEHMKENLDFSLSISPEDMESLKRWKHQDQ